jgi:hypothetical protein
MLEEGTFPDKMPMDWTTRISDLNKLIRENASASINALITEDIDATTLHDGFTLLTYLLGLAGRYEAQRPIIVSIVHRVLHVCKDVNIDSSKYDHQTALYYASCAGLLDVVKRLLSLGANPTTSYDASTCVTAFHGALRGGFIDVAQELLKKGANPNTECVTGVLHGRPRQTPLECCLTLENKTTSEKESKKIRTLIETLCERCPDHVSQLHEHPHSKFFFSDWGMALLSKKYTARAVAAAPSNSAAATSTPIRS